MTILITREDVDAAGLRAAAARSKDAAASRRMLALALIMEGSNRTDAARSAGMDRQTLRDWVHRFNDSGLDGLTNQPNTGAPPRKLSAEQEEEVARWVRQGPSLEQHKVIRWRLVDLREEIAKCFNVQMHERTVGKLMERLSFSRISVRPRHPEQDLALQDAHKKNLRSWSQQPFPNMPATSRSSSGDRMKPRIGSRSCPGWWCSWMVAEPLAKRALPMAL